ncbi:MAG: ScpA family protein [Pseudomonadota bacterium]
MNISATDSPACAKVYGEPLVELPQDLYIPPDALEVFLDAFEGPLDLLLYLIRRQNLDVLNIPMLEVTRQYMQYVELMREKQLELAADYLLMAALLIEIKSRMLLPRPVASQEEEQDPRAELVRRLLEYERMKLAAQELDALPQAGRDFALVQVWLEQAVQKRLPEVNPDDLRQAWLGVAARARACRHHRVTREELSVREHMSLILRRLHGSDFIEFEALFDFDKGLPEIVVTFLALLELARELLVEISQSEAFAAIYVKLTEAGGELE